MKKRILNLGVSATHASITNLAHFNEAVSISDFDAFIIDPNVLMSGVAPENYARRQNEIRDLINQKGGVVVCLVRPSTAIISAAAGHLGNIYTLFAPLSASTQIQQYLQSGYGSNFRVVSNAKGASGSYFRVLNGVLRFAAYLNITETALAGIGGTAFAFDSVSHPIAVEFVIGAGRVCFVPIPEGATGDRVGSAIARIVESHYGGPSEIEAPPWLFEVGVPGANANDATISELEMRRKQIDEEIVQFEQKRTELLSYRLLLYGYGKSSLEPVVRSAFRKLGFRVPEPEGYAGEWDIEVHSDRLSICAIGEIEGSEGVIDVDKYRQLLDYIQTEALEDRDHKGILIGNGFRLTSPEAAERQAQFSNHALLGARKNGFCLLPTVELFKAVCAVLENPADEGLKIRVRDSIISTVGVWTFAREAAVASVAASASSESPADVASRAPTTE